MINIQPNSTFSVLRNTRYSSPVSFGNDFEDSGDSDLDELKSTNRRFERISKNENCPSTLKKIAKAGTVLGTALIGGISMKYGLETTFKLFSKMAENKAVKPIVEGFEGAEKEIKKSFGNFGKSIKNTKKYQKYSKKFKENALGKKIIGLLDKLQKTSFYASIKDGAKNIKAKVKEWFITLAAGITAICSGADALGLVEKKVKQKEKQKDSTKEKNKKEDYDE